MRHNFIPRPARQVLAKSYTVRTGDTLWGIAEAFGQGWSGYAELVGANLHLPLANDVMPQGHAAALAGLVVGQQLLLPASWAPAVRHAGGRADLRASVDAVMGVASAQLQAVIDYYAGLDGVALPWNVGWRQRILNASVQWFRARNPNSTPSADRLAPFNTSAIGWAQTYGGGAPASHAEALPWGEVPWGSVSWKQVPWGSIDWAKVTAWVKGNMPAGAVKNIVPAVPWETLDWSQQIWSAVPWATVPWASVPWSLIPWSSLDWPSIAGGSFSPTVRLLGALKTYADKHPGEPAPPTEEPDLTPGEVCDPPRFLVNGKCHCGPGLTWNPATKKCVKKGSSGPGPDAQTCPLPGHHRDMSGKCVPDAPAELPPTVEVKTGPGWGTALLVVVGVTAAVVASGAADGLMKPAKKAKR